MKKSAVRLFVSMALLSLSTFFGSRVYAQNISGVVNSYARALSIDTCLNVVLVDNSLPFAIGDRVLLFQMKGATIDTTDSPNYGKIINFGVAGNYEFNYVAGINGLQITLRNKILKVYDASKSLQFIKVPQYTNVTINGTLTAKPWDGNTGGVLAFEASGTVTLQSNIDVSATGFRGGDSSQNATGDSKLGYHYSHFSKDGGDKGEGIAEKIYGYEAGRGPQSNGGGGGNNQNAGGGGGSNGGTGGMGGKQTDFFPPISNGGLGGVALDYIANAPQLVMGGGGGGGHANDSRGTQGGQGGGIVIINADTLLISGGSIFSNGQSANKAGADGAGGGGGGGTLALSINKIIGSLQMTAKGGNGGDNDATGLPTRCYAPGGGASGGRVYVNGVIAPVANVTAGKAGTVVLATLPCFGTTYGATDGTDGINQSGFAPFESNIPFTYPSAISRLDTICSGDSVSIGISGGHNFVWTPNVALSDNKAQTPRVFPPATQKYIANYLDDRNCAFSDTVLVVVNARPKPSIVGPLIVCGSDQTTYVAKSTVGANFSWNVSGGNILSGQNTDTLVVQWNNGTSGKVILYAGSKGAACSASDSITIVVNSATKPVITGSKPICDGDSVILKAPPGFTKYKWSNGDTTMTTKIFKSGNYFVQVNFGSGCTLYSDTPTVVVHPLPKPVITPWVVSLPDSGGVDSLFVGGGYTSYGWSTGKAGDTLVILDSGYYSVAVTDSNGCSGTATIHIVRDLATPVVDIATDTITANPCDTVTFPVKIIYSRNLPPSGATNWTTTISFNRTLLVPVDNSIPSVTNGRIRTLTLTGVRPDLLEIGVLRAVPFIVCLGDTTETVVSVETFDFSNGKKAIISKYNGLLKINVCTAGGNRLFSDDGRLLLSQNHPNPAYSITTIDLDLLEEGRSRLFIADMLGRTIKTIYSDERKAGHYSFEVDLRDLPEGKYIYVLHTPSAIRSRIMNIER